MTTTPSRRLPVPSSSSILKPNPVYTQHRAHYACHKQRKPPDVDKNKTYSQCMHFFLLSVQRFNDPRKMHTQHPEPQYTNSTWRQSSFTAHKMPPHDCCRKDAHICMCLVSSIRGLLLLARLSSLCAPIVLRFDEPEIVRARFALLRLLTRPMF